MRIIAGNVEMRGMTFAEKRSYPCASLADGVVGGALRLDAQPRFEMGRTYDHDPGKNMKRVGSPAVVIETSKKFFEDRP